MKKIILVLAATLVAVGAYAQTQKTNRTRTRTHDRSETVADSVAKHENNKPDRMQQKNDVDRNNPDNNTTTKPNTNKK